VLETGDLEARVEILEARLASNTGWTPRTGGSSPRTAIRGQIPPLVIVEGAKTVPS
jgi:hypothetical protein